MQVCRADGVVVVGVYVDSEHHLIRVERVDPSVTEAWASVHVLEVFSLLDQRLFCLRYHYEPVQQLVEPRKVGVSALDSRNDQIGVESIVLTGLA